MNFKECLERDILFLPALYRWASYPFYKILVKTPITANQISISCSICELTAGFLFSFGNYLYSIVAMLLVQASLLLDSVDGDIARTKGSANDYGEWMDLNSTMFTVLPLFLGISIGVYKDTHNIWSFILASIAIGNRYLIEIIRAYKTIFAEAGDIKKAIKELKRFSIMRHFAYCMSNVYFIMIPFVIFDRMFLFLLFVAIYGSLFYIFSLSYLTYKMKKENEA